MIIMKRLIIGIVVCILIASCIVILPITSTVANRLGETDGILTCSVTKKQSSQTTSPVIWDKETFAAFYSLAQTVNATFHGADPHMEYPLEETSYTLYLDTHKASPTYWSSRKETFFSTTACDKQRSIFFFERACISPVPQERNSLASLYPSPWGGENFLSALCAFFWQSMFCSLYGTLPKTLCNFLGISRHKFLCPFVIKREKYFRPFRRRSSSGFEGSPAYYLF